MKLDVVGVGSPVIDTLITKTKAVVLPGGSTTNTLVTLSRLGMKVGLIGRVGNDNYGKMIIDYLEKEGVDISRLRIDNFKTTRYTLNVTPDYSKTVAKENYFPINLEKADLDYLGNCTSVFIYAKNNLLGDIADFTKERRKLFFISLKSLTKSREIHKKIKSSNAKIIFSNDKEAKENKGLMGFLQKRKSTILVVTKGEKGCTVFNENVQKSYPSFTVKCVDPTGAGDVFAGGFIYGYLKSWDIDKTAQFSNWIGALATTEIGSTKKKISSKEIKSFNTF